MTMMTIAICDDMQADARRLHKQLERIVPDRSRVRNSDI